MPRGIYNRVWDFRRKPFIERLFEKIGGDRNFWECWPWLGGCQFSRGGDIYGAIGFEGKTLRAHRAVYELLIHPIPQGLVLDHTCRNTLCCNPFHLEEVTHGENLLRGVNPAAVNARKTHCIHGHPFTPEHTRLTKKGRVCLICKDQWNKSRWDKAHPNEPRPTPFAQRTHCLKGHEYSQSNTRLYRGHRYCRTCGHEADRKKALAQSQERLARRQAKRAMGVI